MAEHTNIEWTDHTFNPVTGCQKVGPGCDNCYAESWAKRSGIVKWGPKEARRVTSAAYWRQPIKWNREAEAAGVRHRVFCASLADVFDNAWPEGVRLRLWDLIRATPHLDWLLLTKRPGNIAEMLPADWGRGYPNVWLGCTVVNQEEADRDIPKLLAVPAVVRFLSMEPLLGPVDLKPWLNPGAFCESCDDGEGWGTHCTANGIPRDEECPWVRAVQIVTEHGPVDESGCPANVTCDVQTLDWIIVGGESGPNARPMHPAWARSIRNQCKAAGVPFLFKQWGEWADQTDAGKVTGSAHRIFTAEGEMLGVGVQNSRFGMGAVEPDWKERGGAWMSKVGKRAAGRLLDGVEHDGVPEVRHA